MRTTIVLNDGLVAEAMRYSNSRSRRALIDEALRLFIQIRAAERRRKEYRERYRTLELELRKLRLRDGPSDLLRAARDRA